MLADGLAGSPSAVGCARRAEPEAANFQHAVQALRDPPARARCQLGSERMTSSASSVLKRAPGMSPNTRQTCTSPAPPTLSTLTRRIAACRNYQSRPPRGLGARFFASSSRPMVNPSEPRCCVVRAGATARARAGVSRGRHSAQREGWASRDGARPARSRRPPARATTRGRPARCDRKPGAPIRFPSS